MSWFWSSGGSILTQIKKKCGLQNKFFFADMNVFGLSFCSCVHFSLPFRHDTHINTGLIWISSFKICSKIRFGRFMLWFKKKEK